MPDTHATTRSRAELAAETREWNRQRARDEGTLDEAALTGAERADDAMRDLYSVAERVAILADRHDGSNGDNPALIGVWVDLLRCVERAMRARLAQGGEQ